jgi:sarcosine oxidase/L-pipecolate oxidase
LHALVDSVEYILNSQDAGEKVLGIFLDFTKAFDTVCHSILLTKLHSFGIYGVAHEWFLSYLTDRKQFVIVEGSVLPELPVKSGVPQGSVLGPLLFILYINDLTTCLTTNAHPVLFADDSNFFIAAESSESAAKKARKTLDEI